MVQVAQVAVFFSDTYKTQKYGVGKKYNSWKLNLLLHNVTSRL